ncbi:MAG: C10 family peptidase, partial [Bacteroidaceae bacterium]|nr:C10 family peptidase [Bacteroidaceae bacterium]
VSGSDCAPGVLGYSNEGTFDASNLPDNMKAWLQGYADQMAWLESHGGQQAEAQVNSRRAGGVKASIAPMIETKWDQDNPYNLDCPDFLNGQKSVTGCVATAMAQVLYYDYQKEGFPAGTTKEIPAYQCATNWGSHVQVPSQPAITFDWVNMRTTYTGKEESTDASAKAVAALMARCGASVSMDYADVLNGGSSASMSSVAQALNDYFGYDRSVTYLRREFFTTAEWEGLIYAELAAGRPVLYGGQSSGGGHAFVCDGYSEDGFFHINFGWSGGGNSYYRLSVANPYTQGIGASSSVDGYTMNQDMVIGIQKPSGAVVENDGRLEVTRLGLNGSTSVTKNRSVATGVNFSYGCMNRLAYTDSYDLAIGLFDEEDNLVGESTTTLVNNLTLANNKGRSGWGNWSINLSEAILPTGKTYTLKAISRISGTEKWSQCFNAANYCIKAEGTSSSQVTLTVVEPAATSLTVSGLPATIDCVKNEITTIEATITNSGSAYHGDLYLIASGVSTPLSGNGISVEAGETTTAIFTFKYTDSAPVVKTLKIATDSKGDNVIWTGSLNVIASVVEGTDAPELTFTTQLNVDGNKILGNQLIGVVTATNSTSANYTGTVALVLHKFEGGFDYSTWWPKNITVPAHSSVDVTYEYDVDYDVKYSVVMMYMHNGSQVNDETTHYVYYYAKPAITTLAADGTEKKKLAEASFTVPADAAVVDLRGQSIVTSITPNSNPNTLYLLDESATIPSGISTNAVLGAKAESIVLADGEDFYAPVDFTATKMTYERTFTQGLTADWKGWSTIVLPFTVEKVTLDGEPIDWFHGSSDTKGRFWVYAFAGDGADEVTFVHADRIMSNTPYIISVPGNAWGEEYNLVGKTLVFEGTDAKVVSGAKVSLSGDNFVFKGGTSEQTLSNVYALDADGQTFEKTASATVEAFRAYFAASSRNTVASALAIRFGDGDEATAIFAPVADGADANANVNADAVYNLNGQQVGTRAQWKSLPRGIYIVNGKKISK